ncbi:hypothetical protein COLSTE_01009, partial [Collinsella stercoris DSM 13279]
MSGLDATAVHASAIVLSSVSILEDEPKDMPDSSDSPTPRPDVAAAPVPIVRADAATRAQRLLQAVGSSARTAVA